MPFRACASAASFRLASLLGTPLPSSFCVLPQLMRAISDGYDVRGLYYWWVAVWVRSPGSWRPRTRFLVWIRRRRRALQRQGVLQSSLWWQN